MTIEARLADGRVLNFPDGTDPAVIQRTVKTLLTPPAAPPTGALDTARDAVNLGGQTARGLVERGAELLGAPIDLLWSGARAVGLPTPTVGAGESLKAGVQAITGYKPPTTPAQKAAYGAGAGVADTASVVVPGGILARGSRAVNAVPTLAQRVGQVASQQPVLQTAAGAVGGGVTGATDSPMAGLLASLAVPIGAATAKRAITPVQSQLTGEQQRLADVARQEHIPLTPAQETGSRPLQVLESVFGTLPQTAHAQRNIQQTQRNAFNRAALERINEGGTEVTPAVLDRARQRIGGDIERLAGQTTVQFDPQFQTDLMSTVMRYGQRLDVQRRPIFENFVRDIVNNGSNLSGKTYQTVRSDLGRLAQNYGGSDPTLAEALRDLRNALDDAAERSMPPNLAGQWREARRGWGNLRTLEKATSNSTTQAAAGNLPPTSFAQAVRQQHPRAYGFGAGEMNDLSRVGTTFVREQIPNSGTPERTMMQNLLTGGIGTTGAAVAMMDPMTALIASGTWFGVPKAAHAAYNSDFGRWWLTNRALAGRGPRVTHGLLGAIGAANAPDADETGLIPVPLEGRR